MKNPIKKMSMKNIRILAICIPLILFTVYTLAGASNTDEAHATEPQEKRKVITVTVVSGHRGQAEKKDMTPEENDITLTQWNEVSSGVYTSNPFAPVSLERNEDIQIMTSIFTYETYPVIDENEQNITTAWKYRNYEMPYNVATASNLKSLGIFEQTAYCLCIICCEHYSFEHPRNVSNPNFKQRTASGTTPRAGRTVAVDTSLIPFGSVLVINGNAYIAEDRGGAIKGKSIDVFFNSHQEALRFGRRQGEVFIVKEETMDIIYGLQ